MLPDTSEPLGTGDPARWASCWLLLGSAVAVLVWSASSAGVVGYRAEFLDLAGFDEFVDGVAYVWISFLITQLPGMIDEQQAPANGILC